MYESFVHYPVCGLQFTISEKGVVGVQLTIIMQSLVILNVSIDILFFEKWASISYEYDHLNYSLQLVGNLAKLSGDPKFY